MRRILGIVLSACLLVGCGKKAEPEDATGPAVQASVTSLTLFRTQPDGTFESDNLSAVVRIENSRSSSIRLSRVEYTVSAGGKSGQTTTRDLNDTVNAGSSTNLKLDSLFVWPNDGDMGARKGRVEGVLYYSSEKNKQISLPFDLQDDLEIQGQ